MSAPTPDDVAWLIKRLQAGVDANRQSQRSGIPVCVTTSDAEAIIAALTASEAREVSLPENLHTDTASLVRRFAVALGEKLYRSQEKYGYGASWSETDWQDKCRADLEHHVAKGDPLDVAAYAAFAWHHGWATGLPASEARVKELEERIQQGNAVVRDTTDAMVLLAGRERDTASARIAALEAEVKGLREAQAWERDEGVYAEAVQRAVADAWPVVPALHESGFNMVGRKLVRRIPEVAAEFAEKAKARAALDGKAVQS